ncbi:hypothetical protein DERF_011303 [Dermatophagoides farinae]|uniref:Uncharacterized protein n=1 Tax=Dermatophagoides farinae TaxID=6954 RepID=A0A922HUN4_DERFA|nr:hypothetical protein DERF_011303 [Dermatophagoides farinae]
MDTQRNGCLTSASFDSKKVHTRLVVFRVLLNNLHSLLLVMMIYNDDDNDGKVLFGKYKFQFLMIRTTTTTAEKKDEYNCTVQTFCQTINNETIFVTQWEILFFDNLSIDK